MLNPVMAEMLVAAHLHDLRADAGSRRRSAALRAMSRTCDGRVRTSEPAWRHWAGLLLPGHAVGCEA